MQRMIRRSKHTGATTCTYYHGAGTAGTMVGTVESVPTVSYGTSKYHGTGTLICESLRCGLLTREPNAVPAPERPYF